MDDEYLSIRVGHETAYVRKDRLDALRETDAAIFDCDGVLIDTRVSYRECIVETVKYLISGLTNVKLPPDVVLREVTHILKQSGGFNNDWDTAYVISLFFLSQMPEAFREEFIAVTQTHAIREGTLRERFDYVTGTIQSKPTGFRIGMDELVVKMKQRARIADVSGVEGVERKAPDSERAMVSATKRFLNYPGNVRESLVSTIFDELFYGPKLFEEIHGRERQFYYGRGYVELEREAVLVTDEVIEELARAIGRRHFGIVSGRDRLSARFSLQGILDKFKQEAMIFLMDSKYLNGLNEEERKRLRKPDPYPLLKSCRGLEPFKYSLYVGDSAEDMIMVRRANELDPRFVSVGVYSLSDYREGLTSYFFKTKTDVIVPSIIELPQLLREVKKQ